MFINAILCLKNKFIHGDIENLFSIGNQKSLMYCNYFDFFKDNYHEFIYTKM